jgi:hypothetical protein
MKKGIALCVAFVGAIVAVWLLRPPQPEAVPPPPPATSARSDQPPAEKASSAPTRKQAAASALASALLPPENLPLRDAFAQLDAQARAGNAQAACRIASELRRCSALAGLVEEAEPLEQTIARVQATHPGTPAELQRQLDEVQRVDARLQEDTAHCEQWSELPNLRHYLLIAARRGHAESIYRYVGMPLNGSDILRDPQLAIDYRANAFALFRRGLEAGDTRLVGLWVRALMDPQESALSAVLPPDWRSRGMLKELFVLVRARFGEHSMPAGFSEPDRIAASEAERAEARRLFDRYFHDAPPPSDPSVPPAQPVGADSDLFGCKQLAP